MSLLLKMSIPVALLSLISVLISQNQLSRFESLLEVVQPSQLNTTVVILNWSRLANVKKIAASICENLLQDTIESIIVWNNNPVALSLSEFKVTKCPNGKLRIINSGKNIYFQARFLACAKATTPYCFIQDDDFFVRPAIIRVLARRMNEEESTTSIHLQPPHEMLSSQLRTITVGSRIYTTFAWLGYGTIVQRFKVIEFLSLLDSLRLSDEDLRMADNYFTILSNEMPQRWFDSGIEMGGGQPFTSGAEGEQRNQRHILRAAEILDSVTLQSIEGDELENFALSYTRLSPPKLTLLSEISVAPCLNRLCIFETFIKLLPDNIFAPAFSAAEIFNLEKARSKSLGQAAILHYLNFPPSNVVDGEIGTAFRSPETGKKDDWVKMDLIHTIPPEVVQVVLQVGQGTEAMLRNSIFELSEDGIIWDVWDNQLDCISMTDAFESAIVAAECRTKPNIAPFRYFRVRLLSNVDEKWDIKEIFVENKLIGYR